MSECICSPSRGSLLIEVDPLQVYRQVKCLITKHPETATLVAEIVGSYGKVLSDLHDDYDTIEKARP